VNVHILVSIFSLPVVVFVYIVFSPEVCFIPRTLFFFSFFNKYTNNYFVDLLLQFYCRDGSLPVSYIKKYLAQKLGLVREAEVTSSVFGYHVNQFVHIKLNNLISFNPSSFPIVDGSGQHFLFFIRRFFPLNLNVQITFCVPIFHLP
jgi:hypothetical protein